MKHFKKGSALWKGFVALVVTTFVFSIFAIDMLRVRTTQASVLELPEPTQMLSLTKAYSLPVLAGLKLDVNNPLNIEFLVDLGDSKDIQEKEASSLIRYFLAALTVPEADLWVNLSPYEEDRIAPEALGETDMGKDLLAQDYVLKQMLSSLTYPDGDVGKDFWKKTYEKVAEVANTTNVPINTFNKVWIVPDKVEILEHKNIALLTEASLDAMMEEDYLAMDTNAKEILDDSDNLEQETIEKVSEVSSAVMREVVLPKIKEEVNNGKHFAQLRQVYNSLVLAMWFKQKFKDSFYKHYFDQAKTEGIDLEDKQVKQKIYNLYVEAFQKGVYNCIEKVYDPQSKRNIKRRYFSGGMELVKAGSAVEAGTEKVDESELANAMAGNSYKKIDSDLKNADKVPDTINELIKLNDKNLTIKEKKKANRRRYDNYREDLNEIPEDVYVVAVDASKLGTINHTNGHAATTFVANAMRNVVTEWLYEQGSIAGKEPGDNSDEFRFIFPADWSKDKIRNSLKELNVLLKKKHESYKQLFLINKISPEQDKAIDIAVKNGLVKFSYLTDGNGTLVYDSSDSRVREYLGKHGLLDQNIETKLWVPSLYMGISKLDHKEILLHGSKRALAVAANTADMVGEANKNQDDPDDFIVFEGEIELENVDYADLPGQARKLNTANKRAKNRHKKLKKLNEERADKGLDSLKLDTKAGVINRYSLATIIAELMENKEQGESEFYITRAPPNEFFAVRRSEVGEIEIFHIDTLYTEKANSNAAKFEDTGRDSIRELDRIISRNLDSVVPAQGVKVLNSTFGHDSVDDVIAYQAMVINSVFGKYKHSNDIPVKAFREISSRLNKQFSKGENAFDTSIVASRVTHLDFVNNEQEHLNLLENGKYKRIAGLMLDRLQQMVDARSFVLEESVVYGDKEKNKTDKKPDIVKNYSDYFFNEFYRDRMEREDDKLKNIQWKRSVQVVLEAEKKNDRVYERSIGVAASAIGYESEPVKYVAKKLSKPYKAKVHVLNQDALEEADMKEVLAFRRLDYLFEMHSKNPKKSLLRKLQEIASKKLRSTLDEEVMQDFLDKAIQAKADGNVFSDIESIINKKDKKALKAIKLEAESGSNKTKTTLYAALVSGDLEKIPYTGVGNKLYEARVANEKERLNRVKDLIELRIDIAIKAIPEMKDRRTAYAQAIDLLSITDGEWAESAFIRTITQLTTMLEMQLKNPDKDNYVRIQTINLYSEIRDILSDGFWALTHDYPYHTASLKKDIHDDVDNYFTFLTKELNEEIEQVDEQLKEDEESGVGVVGILRERRVIVKDFLDNCLKIIKGRTSNSYKFLLLEQAVDSQASLNPKYRPLFEAISENLIRKADLASDLALIREQEEIKTGDDSKVHLALNYVPTPWAFRDMVDTYGDRLAAISSTKGSLTAHWALVAAAENVQTFIFDSADKSISKNNTEVIFDGDNFIASPTSKDSEEYEIRSEKKRKLQEYKNKLAKESKAKVYANADSHKQAQDALDIYFANAVGLVRTEMRYDRILPPSIEGFKKIAESIIKTAGGKSVTFRLFDYKSDKKPLAFSDLDYKGDRWIFEDPLGREVARMQIIALLELRKEGYENFKIMAPMVETVEDLDSFAEIVNEALELSNLKLEDAQLLNLGTMIETKMAIENIDKILDWGLLKFISFGTNDLIDDSYEKAKRYDPEQLTKTKHYTDVLPKIVKNIFDVSKKANDKNIKVSICGDLAALKKFWPVMAYFESKKINIYPSMPGTIMKDYKSMRESIDSIMFAQDNKLVLELFKYLDEMLSNSDDNIDESYQENLNAMLEDIHSLTNEMLQQEAESVSSAIEKSKPKDQSRVDQTDKADVGGIDLQGVVIDSAVGSSAIELAPFDIKDFKGFTFSISSIDDIDSEETVLAFLN